MMRSALLVVLAGVLAPGCGGANPPGGADSSATAVPAAPAPADSQVLAGPGGITVWFTRGREARDSAGGVCLERGLEVRTDSTRRGVPLLYTLEAPTLLDDTSMRAVLYSGCRAGVAYRVDFATVSPRRMTP